MKKVVAIIMLLALMLIPFGCSASNPYNGNYKEVDAAKKLEAYSTIEDAVNGIYDWDAIKVTSKMSTDITMSITGETYTMSMDMEYTMEISSLDMDEMFTSPDFEMVMKMKGTAKANGEKSNINYSAYLKDGYFYADISDSPDVQIEEGKIKIAVEDIFGSSIIDSLLGMVGDGFLEPDEFLNAELEGLKISSDEGKNKYKMEYKSEIDDEVEAEGVTYLILDKDGALVSMRVEAKVNVENNKSDIVFDFEKIEKISFPSNLDSFKELGK